MVRRGLTTRTVRQYEAHLGNTNSWPKRTHDDMRAFLIQHKQILHSQCNTVKQKLLRCDAVLRLSFSSYPNYEICLYVTQY